MIETWIDKLCEVWGGISATGFRTVKSPYLIKKAKFPSAISPDDDFPIALTIPADMTVEYSTGGPIEGHYTGVTEFHITPDLNKANLPSLLPWFGKIWSAAADNMKLSGTVHSFMITKITGPVALKYGDETPHWGFTVDWTVKDASNATITPGDPSVT